MKRLLERLLARQQRLMESLAHPLPAERSVRRTPNFARAQQEQAALDVALALLQSGDIHSARERLIPWAEDAVHVMTLTALAGIASAEGQFDTALAFLEQAELLDPADRDVWRALAQAHALGRRFQQEAQYRRKLVFVEADPAASTLVEWVGAIVRATPVGRKPPKQEIRLAIQKLNAIDDAEPVMRMRMAELVFSCGLRDDALRLYPKIEGAIADEVDSIAKWRRMQDHCALEKIQLHSLVEAGMPGHRPMIAEMSDVIVHPGLQWTPVVGSGAAVLSGHVIQRLKHRSEQPDSPLLMSSEHDAVLRLPRALPVIDSPALLLGGTQEYYHQTVHFLSSLAVAERTGVGADLPLVVNADLAPFQLEQFELLGIDPSRLIRIARNQPVRFERLHVPSRLARGGRWVDPIVSDWYRKRFVVDIGLDRPASRRLYLPCAAASGRLVNETELIAALSARGFEVVRPEILSVREQIKLFAQASHIVGLSGAVFTNMLFAPPNARVITLFNSHSPAVNLHWEALAAACSHRFRALGCTIATVQSGQRIMDADIAVNISATVEALDMLEVAEAHQADSERMRDQP